MINFVTTRDSDLSLWQSAVSETIDQSRNSDERAAALLIATNNLALLKNQGAAPKRVDSFGSREASQLEIDTRLSEIHFQLARARAQGRHSVAARLLKELANLILRYGKHDPLWIESEEEYIAYYLLSRGNPHYRSWKIEGKRDLGFSVIEWQLPTPARVAIIGDWGTGQPAAKRLLEVVAALGPDAIIHLGDVYYSGTEHEYQYNVRELLTAARHPQTRTPIPFFMLAGNHDYYAGGAGFYKLLDALNSRETKQQASYFCLRTRDDGWQFLAVDTGYNDHVTPVWPNVPNPAPGLRDDEIDWLKDKVGSRFLGRTILLSHHQPFSAHETLGHTEEGDPESCNHELLEAINPHFPKISVWIWGHEHNLCVYEEYKGVIGRCLGHSAIPVTAAEEPYAIKHGNHRLKNVRLTCEDGLYRHGFGVVHVASAGRAIRLEYYEVPIQGDQPSAHLLYSEELH